MLRLVTALVFSLAPMASALAIPPPDLIMSAAQSIMQIAGLIFVFVVSILFFVRDFLKMCWRLHRRKIIMSALVLLLILGVFLVILYV